MNRAILAASIILEHSDVNQRSIIEAINLISDESLLTALSEIGKKKDVKPEVLNWLKTQFVKWFKQQPEHDRSFRLSKYDWKEGDPSWAKNKELYQFSGFSDTFEDQLNHIIDFLNTYDATQLKSLFKEPFPVVVKKVENWDESMKKRSQKKTRKDLEEDEDYKVIMDAEAGTWVQLLTMKALKCEGDDMGHCVGRGGYDPKREDIYSLWDENGGSHVTIQAKGKEVIQIKGKSNEAPVKKYVKSVHQFVDKMKLQVKNDGEGIGLDKVMGAYHVPGSESHKNALKADKERVQKLFDEIYNRIVEK